MQKQLAHIIGMISIFHVQLLLLLLSFIDFIFLKILDNANGLPLCRFHSCCFGPSGFL